MSLPKNSKLIPGSFRDPSGFLFFQEGKIYRQVNQVYRHDYDLLMGSGLYKQLTDEGLMIPHEEVDLLGPKPEEAYKTLKPQHLAFISYPYEWCFSQLKDAALLTFKIQEKAMSCGMTLKDCSAYNIQFHEGRPVFIDTLSFEKYKEGQIWVPYRQACQHFLAPLSLMSCKDIRLSQLMRIYIDGIPLDLASSLLPFKTRFRASLLSHIHLHARSQRHYADRKIDKEKYRMNKLAFSGLVSSLESAIASTKWKPAGTEWADYYQDTNYSAEAVKHKKDIISEMLDQTETKILWDMGANDGFYSRIASRKGIYTLSFDLDYSAVEKNYLRSRSSGEKNILPLVLDLTNPSPGTGWANEEREGILKRGPADTVMALALIHHLAISNNLPLGKIASFFSRCCKNLILEFVPKPDSQVQRLLSTREDIFPHYNQESMEKEFGKYFLLARSEKIRDSQRVMYLMHRKGEQQCPGNH